MQILLSQWTAWTIRAKVLNWDLRSKCILRKFLLLSQGLLADHLPKWPQQISTRHFRVIKVFWVKKNTKNCHKHRGFVSNHPFLFMIYPGGFLKKQSWTPINRFFKSWVTSQAEDLVKNPEISPKPFSNVVNDFRHPQFVPPWGQGIVQKDCHDPENKTFFVAIFSASGNPPMIFKWRRSTEMSVCLHLRPRIKLKIPTLQLRKNPSILISKTHMENCDIWIASQIYLQPASFGITLLFHFSERAGKAAGTRNSSRQSWLSIAWCQCAILYPESLRVSAYAVCKNMRHNVLCLIFLLVCLFGVETSRFTQSKFVLCVLCSLFCVRIYGVSCAFCVFPCAVSLACSVLSVVSCVLCMASCLLHERFFWCALLYLHVYVICMYIYI